jgi:hypothetical protein
MEMQLRIGQTDIPNIRIDFECRDEIPQLLSGLRTIYSDRASREKVFGILQKITPVDVNSKNGRPGMDLWKILVLGTLRLNCNWDFDKLHDIANNHMLVREFLGHTIYDFNQRYKLQTVKDNIALFTPEISDEISRAVIRKGHELIPKANETPLKGRCDSFVVETDVHNPTDINLLLDAIRKVLFIIGGLFDELGVTEWRQHRHIFKGIKKQFNVVRRLKHSSSKDEGKRVLRERLVTEAHREYVDAVESLVDRAQKSIEIVGDSGFVEVAEIMIVENFIAHARRRIDQIRRRVLEGETIEHHEKVFSIFEEHTEWICKGKSGVPRELGLGVCILEDQYGYVLHHHVMEKRKDVDIAVSMVSEAKRKFPELSECSFDKGFYSRKNREALGGMLDLVVLPKKGRLSEDERRLEHSPEFVESRRKHSAVESAINALENHALDRCPDHGITGFERYVALAVLARNIQVLGAYVRKKELEKLRRSRRAA